MIWKILGLVDLISAILLYLAYGGNPLIWIILLILTGKGLMSLIG